MPAVGWGIFIVLDISHREAGTAPDAYGPRLKFSYDAIGPLVAIIDGVLITLAGLAGGVGYHWFNLGVVSDADPYLAMGVLTSLAYELLAWNLGLYQPAALLVPQRDYGQLVAAWLGAFLGLALFLFLLKLGSQVSRGAVVTFAGLSLAAIVTWRKFAKRWVSNSLRTGAIHGRRAVVMGTRTELGTVSSRQKLLALGFSEVDRCPLPPSRAPDFRQNCQLAIELALARSRACQAEEIILALRWGDTEMLQFVRECLRASPLPVRLLPDQFVRSIWEGSRSPGLSLIDIQRAPFSRYERTVKRLFDVVAAGSALVVNLPLLLLVAVLIRLDSPGPVIFRQQRKGFNGRPFSIYKFRTMRVMEDGEQIIQAKRHDPRVTRLGRILRATSIDELPQLVNILKGEMSLIGPRPHALAHDTEYGVLISEYALRHHVKPGITGWAQVNGFRGETSDVELMRKRVELDLWYIDNWSLTLDVQIVLRTVVELLRRRNAY
ncbi:undecaprenyl-phosphate glucose phosphotransferase [Xanthobacteraceae bacterium Astr-EGSB]|uniref:undecaprenyl-phosphate glucose phosphotransferase n=1 Tax=Astrobacterium formosum TaxID=3069710 RepID=UPI0027B10791|nr:undecaprenyl-phosphate glucose phosphotransferase [Xanthobacteraceae bacterium Astr-EGSB]